MEARDRARKADLPGALHRPVPPGRAPDAERIRPHRHALRLRDGRGKDQRRAGLGYFRWEYKGKNSDLDKAYEQLLRYRDALDNPPLLIVSDIDHIVIRTNYTNLPTRTHTLLLDDFAHKRLDEAVFAAYGWHSDLSEEEILEKLLALNLERSK
jgi:hypothetical protein